MSIWRRKRRYDENRRFSDRANSALLVVGMLMNEREGIEADSDSEKLISSLSEARELLEELQDALTEPENADNYTYELAQALCDEWRVVPEDGAERLETAIQTILEAEQQRTAVAGLEEARKVLLTVEQIAGDISESEAEQLQDNLAN